VHELRAKVREQKENDFQRHYQARSAEQEKHFAESLKRNEKNH
jgi:hypothetical protein